MSRLCHMHLHFLLIAGLVLGVGLANPKDASSEPTNSSTISEPIFDPYLEAAIREELKQPTGPLGSEELASIIKLSVDGVRDPRGLASLPSLESLVISPIDVEYNLVGDVIFGEVNPEHEGLPMPDSGYFESLSSLTHLTSLIVKGVSLRDLAPLEKLTSLKTLLLSGPDLGDLTPLGALVQLEHLELKSQGRQAPRSTVSLSPLATLARLEELTVWVGAIHDISALSSMHALTRVELSSPDDPLTELPDFSQLPNLGYIEGYDHNLSPERVIEATKNHKASEVRLTIGISGVDFVNSEYGAYEQLFRQANVRLYGMKWEFPDYYGPSH